ncbi:MAG: penicillin-binding protein 2 [Cyanobacteria bacterium P01_H01_bin.15]
MYNDHPPFIPSDTASPETPVWSNPTADYSETQQAPPRSQTPSRAKPQTSTLPTLRPLLVWGLLVASTIALGGRAYRLQVVGSPDLQAKATVQQTMSLRPYLPRRKIVDKNHNVIASDRLVFSLYVHPLMFSASEQEIAETLAPYLEDHTVETLLAKFKEQDTGIRLSRGLSEGAARQLKRFLQKERWEGIDLERQYARYYPHGTTFAEITGYVDGDHQGQAGIEYALQDKLEQAPASYVVRRDGSGQILPAGVPAGLLDFDDRSLQLTLDLRLQQATRKALRKTMAKYSAKHGAVLVMDVRDGSLVSMVCEPTYDPNRYWDADVSLFKNWAVTDLYEPGSTFKPINVAIALDEEVVTRHSMINDTGSVRIDGWTINNHDFRARGYVGIPLILQQSSNIGMIGIMSRLNKTKYYERLRGLGIGDPIGFELPGETPTYLKPQDVFTERSIEAATAAFGQGLSLTPLKLVQLHAAIANGGRLVTPHLVSGIVNAEGETTWRPELTEKQVFKPENSQIVLEMMETVVTNGSGKSSQIPGYRIGGKTGTAQKARPRGGYIPGAKITSYVSLFPVDAPRYAVVAVVDEPQGGNTFGSTVAAPVVKEVMEAIITTQGVPPSDAAAARAGEKQKP